MATHENETMTELEAHRDFSAVLASFVISWGFHAQDKEARASGMDAHREMNRRRAQDEYPDPDQRATHMTGWDARYNAEIAQLRSNAKDLAEMAEASEGGILTITKVQRTSASLAKYLPKELIDMAKKARRLNIID
jgi:hypothetical protein